MATSGQFPEVAPDWNNLSVIHRNTLPPRASFYLYDSESDAIARDPIKSRSQCLSGTWKFHLADNPFEAPDFKNSDISKWSDINVPSMWQLEGHGRGPQYSNVNYTFPVNPPHVPWENNETGNYTRKFTIPENWAGTQIRLRFEGVDSSFHVWVNNKDVGYSQGARNPAEFDITQALTKGENTLSVRVYQWSDGAYLERQDQWSLSGIFRDVFLLSFPKVHIQDFQISTELDEEYKDANLSVRIELSRSSENEEVGLKLLDGAGKDIVSTSTKAAKNVHLQLPVKNPHKWTAETPYLYTLVLSFGDKFVAQRIGFRKTELKDGLFLINGKRIVFRGANRHEHHPDHGRSVPYEFLKQDLLLMKTHNINSIRTCHQPSDPRLYDLADELGFWVMDEADLECHGFAEIDEAALTEEQKRLSFEEKKALIYGGAARWTSDNPKWEEAYVDRAKQLVMRKCLDFVLRDCMS
jgi:beta-galactosidase